MKFFLNIRKLEHNDAYNLIVRFYGFSIREDKKDNKKILFYIWMEKCGLNL